MLMPTASKKAEKQTKALLALSQELAQREGLSCYSQGCLWSHSSSTWKSHGAHASRKRASQFPKVHLKSSLFLKAAIARPRAHSIPSWNGEGDPGFRKGSGRAGNDANGITWVSPWFSSTNQEFTPICSARMKSTKGMLGSCFLKKV